MKITTFRVPGAPQGKARPRVTRYGTYTPKKSREYEQRVREAWMEAGAVCFADSPVCVEVTAVFAPPLSASRKRRTEMLVSGTPAKKPDADNILKAVCDALNGFAWKDDAQVIEAHVRKVYGLTEGVTVTVRQYGKEEQT